jgi:hypothetical protein
LWFAQIEDAEEDKDKPDWVNFKRVIWHESFYKLLKSIEAISVAGFAAHCGDGVTWVVYPLILILSADYEEQ